MGLLKTGERYREAQRKDPQLGATTRRDLKSTWGRVERQHWMIAQEEFGGNGDV